jgi:hypothetical protein
MGGGTYAVGVADVGPTDAYAIVWAAGYSGTTGSFNPLILQNG